jgi:hypothetical protein
MSSARWHSDLNGVGEKTRDETPVRFSFRYNNRANMTGIRALGIVRGERFPRTENGNFLAGHLADGGG